MPSTTHPVPTSGAVGKPPIIGPAPARLASLDAYRGFVMVLMMAGVMNLRSVAKALPESAVWGFLSWNQSHVEWIGASLHDMIQPSFSFLVGVALPFSIANRTLRGELPPMMVRHALWRALVLVLLGVFLRSMSRNITNWSFEDTLTQIGLGYGFLFVLGFGSARAHWLALAAILAGYWAAFAFWPLPGADFDYERVGVSKDWLAAHGLTGFAAHWQKNSNLAWSFDTWFLNLFPREQPFVSNRGGYATLSFIPTLATMILGLIAGNVLRSARAPGARIRWLLVAGIAGLVAGAVLGWTGICPIVKRIWTPSWVLFSGGGCFIFLAGFYWLIDVVHVRRWAFPLVVVGVNSIAAYLIAHLFGAFITKTLLTHLGPDTFRVLGASYELLLRGTTVLLIMWLILYWMYRRKLFLKI